MQGDDLVLRLRLRTDEIDVIRGGLPVDPVREDVLVAVPATFPLTPPRVWVDHDRFLGHAHVLQGDRLCVYLDPSQEWHPTHGVVGFLDRLWTWLGDAAAGRFDARTALYHPVGGVLHATPGTPTVVARDALDPARPHARWWLHERNTQRLDLVPSPRSEADVSLNVVLLPRPLRYGAGSTLARLCAAVAGLERTEVTLLGCGPHLVRQQRAELERFVYLLARTAARNPPCSPLYLVLAVPGPSGDLADPDRHLICGRLAPAATRRLRDAALARGALLAPTMDDIAPDSPIEWCTVSEERGAVVTRRDSRRPANAYLGSHVVLWGCGGIGSWVGEFLARAGAARITLCDPATIIGGLLVRQDYTEDDIGASKADALARRLAVIRDDLVVDVVPEPFRLLDGASLPDCDLLVDATVSNAVAHCLGLVWDRTGPRPLVGRMSTDRATSTLGLLTVTRPGAGPTPEEADRQTGAAIHGDPALETYRCFWETASPGDEVIPEPGCSVPTFHGSAADLASVAGTLVSLLGPHLLTLAPVGSHLIGLPHSDAGLVGHRWLEVREADGPGSTTSTTS